MYANSRLVISDQVDIHPKLIQYLEKHLHQPFKKPIQAHTLKAFAQLYPLCLEYKERLILDSGCGNGQSSIYLAKQYPEYLVIGIDKSIARLSKNTQNKPFFQQDNWVLLRANLIDFWYLLVKANFILQKHYIFYPNPYPKTSQLTKRWYGHAIFPTLLALKGYLEVRSNWSLYLKDFQAAIAYSINKQFYYQSFIPLSPITAFEAKYLASGHSLYYGYVNL